MKTPTHHSTRVHLETVMIAFFILAALSLLVVYLADPSIYAQSLALTSSPADRYPVPVTLFLVGILAMIALLILGVMHHWRWLFWLLLLAFASSALQIPVCNGYLEYPFEKMTISSFPPISNLAKWNSIKEEAREFFSSFQRNSLNATRKTHASLLNTLKKAMREMY